MNGLLQFRVKDFSGIPHLYIFTHKSVITSFHLKGDLASEVVYGLFHNKWSKIEKKFPPSCPQFSSNFNCRTSQVLK